MNDLVARISDAIQRQHDLIEEMQHLREEFQLTINHIKVETERLQARYEYQTNQPLPASAHVIHMPTAPDLDDEFRIPAGIRPKP